MKSRPILFSAPMIRALLAGTKTQTRRIYNPKPGYPREDGEITPTSAARWTDWGPCPHGAPGDRLWVKETHSFVPDGEEAGGVGRVLYAADGERHGKLRPSIHMPRWASRITLELTDVRVERLQDISEADAVAEGVSVVRSPNLLTIVSEGGSTCQITPDHIHGVPKPGDDWMGRKVTQVEPCPGKLLDTARDSYRRLWESLNGPGSWDANPYVWVETFRRVEP